MAKHLPRALSVLVSWNPLPHALRHTFAVHSLKQGTSVEVLQKALGLVDRKATAVYVELARGEMDRQLQEHAL